MGAYVIVQASTLTLATAELESTLQESDVKHERQETRYTYGRDKAAAVSCPLIPKVQEDLSTSPSLVYFVDSGSSTHSPATTAQRPSLFPLA